MTFYPELLKFLAQSKTDSLGTNQFPNEYLGLKVKVSFGKGRKAHVPWIAFLLPNNTIPNGIYPVYLLFKEVNLLILAFGVSETKAPLNKWKVEDPIKLVDYFGKMNLGALSRYGNSYLFKSYDAGKLPHKDEMDADLNNLIEIYKEN